VSVSTVAPPATPTVTKIFSDGDITLWWSCGGDLDGDGVPETASKSFKMWATVSATTRTTWQCVSQFTPTASIFPDLAAGLTECVFLSAFASNPQGLAFGPGGGLAGADGRLLNILPNAVSVLVGATADACQAFGTIIYTGPVLPTLLPDSWSTFFRWLPAPALKDNFLQAGIGVKSATKANP